MVPLRPLLTPLHVYTFNFFYFALFYAILKTLPTLPLGDKEGPLYTYILSIFFIFTLFWLLLNTSTFTFFSTHVFTPFS